MRPSTPAAGYEVVIEMGAPPPAAAGGIDASIVIDGGPPQHVRVQGVFAEHRVRIGAPADGVVDVELRAETWSRTGQSAALGVAVRRVTVLPVASAALLPLR
jgi:hypothetical protein